MNAMGVPQHIAIIMDGNGRWAASREKPRWEGHRHGATRVRPIVEACKKRGVQALTIFAFSEQNWGRPDKEVSLLMELLATFIQDEKQNLIDENIRVVTIGEVERLPPQARNAIEDLVSSTSNNDEFTLAIALSYGGREELVRAARTMTEEVISGKIKTEDITLDTMNSKLDTAGIPWEVDLIIRTSGEHRLSNFLLWQCAYAEFYFTDVHWPDFSVEDLDLAITTYQTRERRFGLLSPDKIP